MPTYQYACPDCGLEFEKVQKFTDDAIKKCPKCSKRHVYRVVSKVAVTFKGSGWYITDSKSNNSAGTAGKDKDKEKGDGAEAKAESSEKKEVTTESTPAEPAKETKPEKTDKAEKKPKKKAD
jgi:putative FmdB family regulatory protein